MFAGFRSRWTSPSACSASSPLATWRQSVHGRLERQRSLALDPVLQRAAGDELLRHVGDARRARRCRAPAPRAGGRPAGGARLAIEALAEDRVSAASSSRTSLSATSRPSGPRRLGTRAPSRPRRAGTRSGRGRRDRLQRASQRPPVGGCRPLRPSLDPLGPARSRWNVVALRRARLELERHVVRAGRRVDQRPGPHGALGHGRHDGDGRLLRRQRPLDAPELARRLEVGQRQDRQHDDLRHRSRAPRRPSRSDRLRSARGRA